jgi:RES domain-containing protein
MRVWRLTRAAYARDPLSGLGAARAGSRWNSAGVRLGYASTSRPLAVLEMLVHVTRETVPDDLALIPMDVPDEGIAVLHTPPAGWNELPFSASARAMGDRWAARRASLALSVPSVVLPLERNLLINPLHPDFHTVAVGKPEDIAFDRRLLR